METLSMYLLDGQQYMVHAAADAHGNGTCENHLNFPHGVGLAWIADRGLSCVCRLRHQHQGPRDLAPAARQPALPSGGDGIEHPRLPKERKGR